MADNLSPAFATALQQGTATIGTPNGGSYTAYTPPNPSSPISGSQIVNGSGLNFPPASTSDNGQSLVAGVVGGSQATPPPTKSSTPNLDLATTGDYNLDPNYKAASDTLATSQTNLNSEMNKLPSQADLLKQAQTDTGATDKLNTLNDINSQLASAVGNFDMASQNAETNGIQKGTPAVFYQGEQAAIQRQKAVVVGALSTRQLAAQGNYDSAEKLAEQTSLLKFNDAQAKITNLQNFVKINQDSLSAAERSAAAKMSAQATLLQQQLDKQKTLYTLALTAGVTKPFMNIGGTVVRTSDGKQFSSAEEAAAAGVNIKDWSNVQTVDPSKISQKFTQIGVDDFGQPVYGFANEAKGTVTPITSSVGGYTATGNSLTSPNPNPSKVINGYDFSTYATDPNWGNAVKSILTKIPDLPTSSASSQLNVADAQASILQDYIKQIAPSSKLTGEMIVNSAKQYGVDPKTLTAILQQESQFGTTGLGAKTFNPGNVGNTDSGATKNMGDWQSGIDAVASNMAQRSVKTGTGNQASQTAFAQYGLLANTDFKPTDTVDQLAQKYLDQYIKNGSIPTASTLGRNIKPQMMATIDSRARDLYFKATGTALPNPQVLKGYQDLVINNNKLANNLAIQENTVKENVDLSLANMKKNGLNSAGFKPLDSLLNSINDAFNDPATGQLIAQNSTIQNELGSLLAVKNASGTTVYDKLSSAGIISKNDNEAQIKSKVNALLKEAANFATSIKTANASAYKQIDPLIQDPNNPIITLSKAKGFDYAGALHEGHSYDEIINFLQQQ